MRTTANPGENHSDIRPASRQAEPVTSFALRAGTALAASALGLATLVPPAKAAPGGIDWGRCESGSPAGYQCARVPVPLSYRDPDGPRLSLAVGLLPAVDQKHKLGTVFANPGGPGNPGRFAPALTPELHQRFDIVGFDPRGVGASTPLRCFTDPRQAEEFAGVIGDFPRTTTERARHKAAVARLTGLCERNAGPLGKHLSTANTARDLDRLRAAIGEPKLRYYGLSYGTYLGEVYANLFPNRAGALALDAVDDPVNWTSGYRPAQARIPMSTRLGGYRDAERALDSFFTACAADTRCAFRGGDLRARYDRILDRLETGPVTITDPETGAPQRVRYQDAIARVHEALTDSANSPGLAGFLAALEHPLPERSTARAGVPTPADSMLGGGATLCADAANPRDPDVWPRYAAAADRQARGFGSYDTYKTLPCATWDVADADRYPGPWNRSTAPILLLADRKGDPETPYAGAERTARLLGKARLLALDDFGHGARGKSRCIDAALNAYLSSGTLPARGTVCRPDRAPFDG